MGPWFNLDLKSSSGNWGFVKPVSRRKQLTGNKEKIVLVFFHQSTQSYSWGYQMHGPVQLPTKEAAQRMADRNLVRDGNCKLINSDNDPLLNLL